MTRSTHQTARVLLALVAGLALMLVASAGEARADRGVGISGSITINDELSPGRRYSLPSITVINTGDEPGEYQLQLTFREGQEELRVREEWVIFEPQAFHLEAAERMPVGISLRIPNGARPGEYFAFIEAQSIPEGPGTQVGIAAASRLRFVVKPSTLIEGYFNNVRTFFEDFAIWAWTGVGIFVAAIIVYSFKRWVRVRIRLERQP